MNLFRRIPRFVKITVFAVISVLILYQILQRFFSYDFRSAKAMGPLNDELKTRVNKYVLAETGIEPEQGTVSPEKLMDISNTFVAGLLSYTGGRSVYDPVEAYEVKEVDCSGYAALQTAVLNYMFREYGAKGWKAEWHSGRVKYAGVWVGPYLGSHCYPVVTDPDGNKEYPDACFKDVLFDGYFVHKENK